MRSLPLVFCLLLVRSLALGQCTLQSRVYATTQQVNAGVLTSVTSASNAADGNVQDYSTLNRLLGVGSLVTVTQYIKFASTVTAGTAVTVKVGIPTGLVSLLGGISLQPFTNLHNDVSTGFTWQATAVGQAITGASLLGLINGAGDQEITFTPKTSGGVNVGYDGVWVQMGGVAVAQSINVFGAYLTQNITSGTIGCSVPVDVLAGVLAGTVVGGIANATGSVTNKYNAIDTDPTYSTYASLDVGVQALSEVYHTTIFNSPSQSGDYVRMIIQDPGGGLLSLGLLSNFTIQLYNGSTAVGAPFVSTSTQLALSLLPGGTSTNQKYELDIVPPTTYGTFDRVQVLVGGLATVGLVQGLRIYDVKKIIATPVTKINGVTTTSQSVCSGSTATLAVQNTQQCTSYKWYDSATGGTVLGTDSTYTPSAGSLGSTNTYYVEAQRNGCSETSTRTPVSIIVNPPPTVHTVTTPTVCRGQVGTTVTYTGTNAPNTYSIVWDSTALGAGFLNVTNAVLPAGAIPVTVPANAPAATYNGTITVQNANGCLSTGMPFSINLEATPTRPVINIAN